LLVAGFDHADIDVMAGLDAVGRRLGFAHGPSARDRTHQG
jgi:hypothetical protein